MDVEVVTVSRSGEVLGTLDRLDAHRAPGVLHLAVSVMVTTPWGWLVQQRSDHKAAFPGAWANSCCTHPLPGEEPAVAAVRRVREELGVDVADVVECGAFVYRAVDPVSGLVEFEFDRVLVASAEQRAVPDPAEVADVRYVAAEQVLTELTGDGAAPWAATVARRALGAVRSAG